MSDLKDALIGLNVYREESRPHLRPILAELDREAVTPGRVKKLIKTLQDVDAEIRGVVGEINTEGDLQNARRLKDELKDHIRNLKRHVSDLGG
jgi:gas vesicle protein